MVLQVRHARPGDIVSCAQVFLGAQRDLSARFGSPPEAFSTLDVTRSFRHLLATDPQRFFVAVNEGRVVCFASTILRGSWLFLSSFWALPKLQGQGIGRRVLTRAFMETRVPRRVVRCVYASLDLRAQGLYLRFGMLPRTLVYTLKGTPAYTSPPARRVELRQMGPTDEFTKEASSVAARFDLRLRGGRRDQDHRFLFRDAGRRFYAARYDGNTVGYVVVSEQGKIGPGGVLHPSFSAALAWSALEKVREFGADRVSMMAPGVNDGTLRVGFEAGLKIESPATWMSSREVGDMASYIPVSPALY